MATPKRIRPGQSGINSIAKKRWRLQHFFGIAGLSLLGFMIIVFQRAHQNIVATGTTASKIIPAAERGRLLEDFKRGSMAGGDAIDNPEPSTNNKMIQANQMTLTPHFLASAKHPGKLNTHQNNMWDQPSAVLPDWLKEYFSWHQQQIIVLREKWESLLHHKNSIEAINYLWDQPDQPQKENKMKFMVIRCFSFDRKCGGLADRVLPLPYLLQMAHNTSRVLLIHFQRPAPLEEYLVPPKGGIDWRIPSWLVPAFNFTPDSRRYKTENTLLWHAHNENETVVQTIFQSYHYGSQPYNKQLEPGEPTFRQVVRSIWSVMFTPVAPIQRLIRQEMNSLGLREGYFAAIHCRVLYAVQERDPAEIRVMTENALHCASELYNAHGPFFIASDSPQSSKTAIDYARQLAEAASSPDHRTMLVARSTHKTPAHFDRIPSNDKKEAPSLASDYYDTYVDLYLMAMAECVTHGKGGYGILASFLSYNESCSSHHFKNKMRVCAWHPDTGSSSDKLHDRELRHDPLLPSLLAPAMD